MVINLNSRTAKEANQRVIQNRKKGIRIMMAAAIWAAR